MIPGATSSHGVRTSPERGHTDGRMALHWSAVLVMETLIERYNLCKIKPVWTLERLEKDKLIKDARTNLVLTDLTSK